MRRLLIILLGLSFAALAQATELLYLNSAGGSQRLLHADYNSQYFAVQPFVDTQENLAFCGPASMAAVLNSLPRETRPISPSSNPFLISRRTLFSTRERLLLKAARQPEVWTDPTTKWRHDAQLWRSCRCLLW